MAQSRGLLIGGLIAIPVGILLWGIIGIGGLIITLGGVVAAVMGATRRG